MKKMILLYLSIFAIFALISCQTIVESIVYGVYSGNERRVEQSKYSARFIQDKDYTDSFLQTNSHYLIFSRNLDNRGVYCTKIDLMIYMHENSGVKMGDMIIEKRKCFDDLALVYSSKQIDSVVITNISYRMQKKNQEGWDYVDKLVNIVCPINPAKKVQYLGSLRCVVNDLNVSNLVMIDDSAKDFSAIQKMEISVKIRKEIRQSIESNNYSINAK